MTIVADTHVHLYPVYRLENWLCAAANGLAGCATAAGVPGAVRAVLLTESCGCDAWFAWAEQRGLSAAPWSFRPSTEDGAGQFVHPERGEVWVFAGRQVVTRERIEVLSLLSKARIADGLPLEETLRAVRAQGGVPTLTWAPGKWLGARGRGIVGLLEKEDPAGLCLGDNRMRPGWCGDPPLLKRALRKGFRILAGSDPLPFAGEERQVGRYASVLEAEFDSARPVTSVRSALMAVGTSPRRVGARNGLFECAVRFWRNRKVTKSTASPDGAGQT